MPEPERMVSRQVRAPTVRATVPTSTAAATAGFGAAAVIALFMQWGPDWPAQQFRAWTAAHGLTAWTNNWYSGLALPGYSVLYPPVSAVLGAGGTAVLAVGVAMAAAHGFAPHGLRAVGFDVTVLIVLCADLVIGQVPYLLGVAIGAWGLRAVRADVVWSVPLLLAVGASLASPLVGLFLLLGGPAIWCAVGLRRALPLLGGVVGPAVAALTGGASGTFPYLTLSIYWTAIFVVVGLVLTTSAQRPLQVFALTVGAVAVLDILIPNPIGGNLVRIGQLTAVPLVWLALPGLRLRTPLVAAVLIGAAGLWPVFPAVTAAAKGALQPSRHADFYSGLRRFLATQDPRRGRLEAVFTRQHWESYYVATAFPIARGWEQQSDQTDNAVLYRPLTAAIYRRWLDENAVDLVALPREPLDVHAGVYEGALLAHPPGYLVPVWHDAHWQVWRVREARPLAGAPARLTSLGTASFALRFTRPGTSTVRIHSGTLWSVTSGDACLSSTPGRWLQVRARTAGSVTVRARVDLHTVVRAMGSPC